MILMLVAKLENKSHQFIAGISIVDPIKKVQLIPTRVTFNSSKFAGINRLWVHSSVRRKALGTWLTNASRRLLYPNVQMNDTRAAFYFPTGDALKFVTAYFGNQQGRYLAYEDD